MRKISINYITNDRKLGRHLSRPEGLLTSSIRGFELLTANKLGNFERSRVIKEGVDKSFYRPNKSLNDDLVDRIRNKLDNKMETAGKEPVATDRGVAKCSFVSHNSTNFKDVEGFEELLQSSIVEETVRGYFGSKYKFDYAGACWYYITGKDEKIQNSDWHLDAHERASKLRMFVFLSDESKRETPLQVVGRSETKEICSKYTLEELRENPEIVENNADINEFSGSKGDFILFNPSRNLHRAGLPTKGEHPRKVMMIDFIPRYKILER